MSAISLILILIPIPCCYKITSVNFRSSILPFKSLQSCLYINTPQLYLMVSSIDDGNDFLTHFGMAIGNLWKKPDTKIMF